MPLPLIVGGIAAVSGLSGIGTGIHGGYKMKHAKNDVKNAEKILAFRMIYGTIKTAKG